MTDPSPTGRSDAAARTTDGNRRRPPLVLRGFGPLVVGLLLALAVVLMVPSVAPERVVVQPGAPVPAGEQAEDQEATP